MNITLTIVQASSSSAKYYDVILLLYTVPPRIVTEPQDITTPVDQDIVFRCRAEGYPMPTISWEHNGELVSDRRQDFAIYEWYDDKAMTAVSELRILSTDVRHTGRVACNVSAAPPVNTIIARALESQSKMASLTVLGK